MKKLFGLSLIIGVGASSLSFAQEAKLKGGCFMRYVNSPYSSRGTTPGIKYESPLAEFRFGKNEKYEDEYVATVKDALAEIKIVLPSNSRTAQITYQDSFSKKLGPTSNSFQKKGDGSYGLLEVFDMRIRKRVDTGSRDQFKLLESSFNSLHLVCNLWIPEPSAEK